MDINNICNKVSSKLNIDKDVVHKIFMFEFKFTTDIMKDPDNCDDILFNKLFKFKLKPRFKNNKTKDYSPNENS